MSTEVLVSQETKHSSLHQSRAHLPLFCPLYCGDICLRWRHNGRPSSGLRVGSCPRDRACAVDVKTYNKHAGPIGRVFKSAGPQWLTRVELGSDASILILVSVTNHMNKRGVGGVITHVVARSQSRRAVYRSACLARLCTLATHYTSSWPNMLICTRLVCFVNEPRRE